MCVPTWPWTDIYVETQQPKKKKVNGEYFWDPVINGWVKLTGVAVSAMVSSI
jgi:hypothetical protein